MATAAQGEREDLDQHAHDPKRSLEPRPRHLRPPPRTPIITTTTCTMTTTMASPYDAFVD